MIMRQANHQFLFYASGRRFCSALRANLEMKRRQDMFAMVRMTLLFDRMWAGFRLHSPLTTVRLQDLLTVHMNSCMSMQL